MDLVSPAPEYLASYLESLERGWSSETSAEDVEVAADERRAILADPDAFIVEMNHPTRLGRPVRLPGGREVPRLPSERRWMWDGQYCGAISVRFTPGTHDLPPHCLGHVGYAVVPWQRRRGHATSALAQLLPIAADQGLEWVDLVTSVDNDASQRVIRANGGRRIEEFVAPVESGAFAAIRWRILLR
jgi:predicted acetyltransferase